MIHIMATRTKSSDATSVGTPIPLPYTRVIAMPTVPHTIIHRIGPNVIQMDSPLLICQTFDRYILATVPCLIFYLVSANLVERSRC